MGGRGSGRRAKDPKFKPAPDRQLYERQHREGDKAWKSFVIYRDLGVERSVRRVLEEIEKLALPGKWSFAVLTRWCTRWGWRDRCESWDNELDRQKRLTDLAAVAKMRERHLNISTALISLGATELNKWLKYVQAKSQEQSRSLSPSDILKIIESGISLERQGRGEPGQIIEERKKKDVDPEQVKARIDQLLKARKLKND